MGVQWPGVSIHKRYNSEVYTLPRALSGMGLTMSCAVSLEFISGFISNCQRFDVVYMCLCTELILLYAL